MIRKILYLSLWVGISAGLLLLFVFEKAEYGSRVCKTMNIRITNPTDYPMIDKKGVEELILKAQNPIIGNYMSVIDIRRIKRSLITSSFVTSAEVYSSITGDIYVNVTQRIPIVRVINEVGENYYIDSAGWVIPYQVAHPAKVIIATGLIPESFNFVERPRVSVKMLDKLSPLRKIYALSEQMSKDHFFESLIGQIYINDKQEIELTPRFGDQLIMFGDTSDIKHKIGNLEAFYSNVMDKVGWTTYDTINVKFRNQVVCTN